MDKASEGERVPKPLRTLACGGDLMESPSRVTPAARLPNCQKRLYKAIVVTNSVDQAMAALSATQLQMQTGKPTSENRMHDPNQISPQSATFPLQHPSISIPETSAPPSVNHLQRPPMTPSLNHDLNMPHSPPEHPPPAVPDFVKSFSEKIGPEEAQFLRRKGALSLPDPELRSALLESYVNFVYPYVPTVELNDFFSIVQHEDGSQGKVSLLVFQALMFAGSSFVDYSHLKRAGFRSRQEARKAFYQKARLLYDFDYEDDRIALLQALLLMTYWYESPNDQKDTWHWLGVAISVATSIGLNRDPSWGPLDKRRQSLWKRLWWSTVIRDRLIAIGMRRPLRIKSSEHNVPMLTLDDFPLEPLSSNITVVGPSCVVAYDAGMRASLAQLCIAKAQFCACIGHVLTSQYSQPTSNRNFATEPVTTEVLLPNRKENPSSEVAACASEIDAWINNLCPEAQLPDDLDAIASSKHSAPPPNAPFVLARALLHAVYYMTLSALHRPQADALHHSTTPCSHLFAVGPANPRDHVRYAAFRITQIAQYLLRQSLVRFLPTTGVTVLQPAIISHMMDVKSSDLDVRTQGLKGFCQSIEALNRLRDIYAGAEYSVMIIDAAVRRANIDTSAWPIFKPPQSESQDTKQESPMPDQQPPGTTAPASTLKPPLPSASGATTPRRFLSIEDLVDAGLRQQIVHPSSMQVPPTPPPEGANGAVLGHENLSGGRQAAKSILNDEAVATRLAMYLATTTPPASANPETDTASFPFSHPHHQNHGHNGENVHPGFKAENPALRLDPYGLKPEGDNWTPRLGNVTLSRTPRMHGALTPAGGDLDRDFETLINTEELVDAFTNSGDGGLAVQGESSGFFFELGMMGDGDLGFGM
ncbi:MAG: hypothetical protein Q9159_002037 [Coniocarpon cinnabarinum]